MIVRALLRADANARRNSVAQSFRLMTAPSVSSTSSVSFRLPSPDTAEKQRVADEADDLYSYSPTFSDPPSTASPPRAVNSEQYAEVERGAQDDDDDDDDEGNETDAELHRTMPATTSKSTSLGKRKQPPPPPQQQQQQQQQESSAAMGPPPPRKQRRLVFEVKSKSFVPRYLEALREGRADADGIMPKSRPELLHELSMRDVPDIPLERSIYLRAIVRECELIASSGGLLRAKSNVQDLRRLLRLLDDYALTKRPEKRDSPVMSMMHVYALFIARMKILNVLENCLSKQTLMEADEDLYVENHYYREAEQITPRQLALWLLDKNACHIDMLVVDRTTAQPSHRIQSCSLECFWQSLLSLMAAWPYQVMCGFLVRVFNEMRRRCAFFLSYREFSSEHAKAEFDRQERKVMGLNASLFALTTFDSSPDAAAAAESGGSAMRIIGVSDGALLDNFTLATIGEDGFVNVNTEFVDQCEMIFHYMQLSLRQGAGFKRSPLDTTALLDATNTPYVPEKRPPLNALPPPAPECLMCRRETRAAITADHVKRLESLIAGEVSGTFRVSITEEFREVLMVEYLQPSEMAEFGAMHEREVQKPGNCISRQRQADYRKLSDKLLLPAVADVWKTLRGQYDEPAYTCLAAIAMNFHFQQHFKGGEFVHYLVRADSLTPFAHLDERLAARRNLLAELHTQTVTTGTVRYRNLLLQQQGSNAEMAERQYQHPLMLKTVNGIDVIYREHTHRVRGFAHGFLHWLELMCNDRCIRGQLALGGGASLYPLYRLLFPERARVIDSLEQKLTLKLRRYNPVQRLVGDTDLDDDEVENENGEHKSASSSKRDKLPMYERMSQF
jgi:hypothetical protein